MTRTHRRKEGTKDCLATPSNPFEFNIPGKIHLYLAKPVPLNHFTAF